MSLRVAAGEYRRLCGSHNTVPVGVDDHGRRARDPVRALRCVRLPRQRHNLDYLRPVVPQMTRVAWHMLFFAITGTSVVAGYAVDVAPWSRGARLGTHAMMGLALGLAFL